MKSIITYVALIIFSFKGFLGDAQIITTVAGTCGWMSSCGYSENCSATTAAMNYNNSVNFDKKGNMYIAEGCVGGSVQIVNKSGIINTFAGMCYDSSAGDGGQATNAYLKRPNDIAFDRFGNLYITDLHALVIRKVSTNGIISTVAGNGVVGFSGDGGPATDAEFFSPWTLTCDKSGNIYVADNGAASVRKIDLAGNISKFAGNGIGGFSGDGGQATSAELGAPQAIRFDAIGNLYISTSFDSRIRKVDTSGIITTIAGIGILGYTGDGGLATDAEISEVGGIAFDQMGNIFIADTYNDVVREINYLSGIITTVVGNGTLGHSGDGGPAIDAELYGPECIIFDTVGNLFIPDYQNGCIRRVTGLSITTGQSKIPDLDKISVYPNPANNTLTIAINEIREKLQVTMYNLLGEQIWNQSTSEKQAIIVDISFIPNGTYLLHILAEDGTSTNRKIEIIR